MHRDGVENFELRVRSEVIDVEPQNRIEPQDLGSSDEIGVMRRSAGDGRPRHDHKKLRERTVGLLGQREEFTKPIEHFARFTRREPQSIRLSSLCRRDRELSYDLRKKMKGVAAHLKSRDGSSGDKKLSVVFNCTVRVVPLPRPVLSKATPAARVPTKEGSPCHNESIGTASQHFVC